MDRHQLLLLLEALYICKDEIISKLEEVRCGIIDVENEIIKIREGKEGESGSETSNAD